MSFKNFTSVHLSEYIDVEVLAGAIVSRVGKALLVWDVTSQY